MTRACGPPTRCLRRSSPDRALTPRTGRNRRNSGTPGTDNGPELGFCLRRVFHLLHRGRPAAGAATALLLRVRGAGLDDVTVLQVHPDADSMPIHIKVGREHFSTAYARYLEPESALQIYGTLSDEPMRAISAVAKASGSASSVTTRKPSTAFDRLPARDRRLARTRRPGHVVERRVFQRLGGPAHCVALRSPRPRCRSRDVAASVAAMVHGRAPVSITIGRRPRHVTSSSRSARRRPTHARRQRPPQARRASGTDESSQFCSGRVRVRSCSRRTRPARE